MKAFWAVVALLAVAAAVLLGTNLGDEPAPLAPKTTTPSQPAPPPAQVEPPPPAPRVNAPPPAVSNPGDPAPAPTRAAPQTAAPAPAPMPAEPPKTQSPEPSAKTPEQPEKPQPEETHPAEATAPSAPVVTPAPGSADDENLLIKLRQEIENERAKREAEAKAKAAAPSAPPAETGNTEPAPPSEGSGLFGNAAAESKPDGSILVEGKFVVTGKGTQAEPYKITWDHLISAERDYAPKEGKKSIPPRIQALNDAWVEITGFVAFPLMANETDELLSMMNQWDGCCIGIPPTPYDAIEVRLSDAVAGDARLTTYGTIKGKFKVDPHLVGGWLVGLYVIDQGKLTPVAFGGVAP